MIVTGQSGGWFDGRPDGLGAGLVPRFWPWKTIAGLCGLQDSSPIWMNCCWRSGRISYDGIEPIIVCELRVGMRRHGFRGFVLPRESLRWNAV